MKSTLFNFYLFCVCFFLLFSLSEANLNAQYANVGGAISGADMGHGNPKAPKENNPNKKDDGKKDDPQRIKIKEIAGFDKFILPLLKEKQISEEKIAELRQTSKYELGNKLMELGINPNDIEVDERRLRF